MKKKGRGGKRGKNNTGSTSIAQERTRKKEEGVCPGGKREEKKRIDRDRTYVANGLRGPIAPGTHIGKEGGGRKKKRGKSFICL